MARPITSTFEQSPPRPTLQLQLERLLSLGFLCVLGAFALSVVLDQPALLWVTAEDNAIEAAGAYLWLAGAVVLFADFYQHKRPSQLFGFRSDRNMYSLLLAVVFFLAFGEEISWGQRALGLTPPPAVAALNAQQEITIHNLTFFNPVNRDGELRQGWARLFNFSALFNISWFTAFVLLPLSKRVAPLRRFYHRWGVPVAPLGFGLLMMINYLALKIGSAFVPAKLQPALTEIAEANFAIVFMLVAFALYLEHEVPLLARVAARIGGRVRERARYSPQLGAHAR